MKEIQENDTVKVALVGKLDNETVFETVEESEPRVYKMGDEATPKQIQRTLLGMRVGETRSVKLTAEEGEFGIRRGDLLQEIPMEQFTDKIEPKVGLLLSMNVESGGKAHQVPATIVEIKEDRVIIDYNHPMAGHSLNYELTVVAINDD
ncbi:MAG: FKBP-type peptidyl-prolyl cis-trans isomerase [Thermodesulfobacteriota bacterium]